MKTSDTAPLGNLIVSWGDSTPPAIVKLYDITTPLNKYIGVDGATGTVGLTPLYYWVQPDASYTSDLVGYTIRIYPASEQRLIEERLKPAIIVMVKLYLPRFDEEEWRKLNRITLASI